MSQNDDDLRQKIALVIEHARFNSVHFTATKEEARKNIEFETDQAMQAFAAEHARLLADLREKMPEKYDLSGISDPYVEHPYEWGANQTIDQALAAIDAELDRLKETKA